MGQIANCQYVCNAINAYAGRSYIPAANGANWAANVNYLMKMIDKTTRDITGGGTTASNYQASYTSMQAVDTTGVSQVLPLIKWMVTAPGSIANGSITVSATYVRYGQTVTVTISPSSGYELNTVSATGATLSGSGDTRTFTMPKDNVTITGSFKAIFQTIHRTTPGTYSHTLPVGTFKMTAVSGKGGTGGIGGSWSGQSNCGPGGTGASRTKAVVTFSVSTQSTVTVVVGEDGKNGSQGQFREGSGKDTTTYNTGGVGGSATIGNGQPGDHGEPLTETAYGCSPAGGGGSGGGASGIVDKYYVAGGGGGGGGGYPRWTGQNYATGYAGSNGSGSTGGTGAPSYSGPGQITGIGGKGGNGGSLSGTAVTGTTTTDNPYVKIELA
jgi:hypothetical protein